MTAAEFAARARSHHDSATPIGRALDSGAAGVIVPLVNSADDAATAATRYPPAGIRSFGPLRSDLRIGPCVSVDEEKAGWCSIAPMTDDEKPVVRNRSCTSERLRS